MKEQIFTIPVNEAFDQKGECPFCNMYNKLECDSIDYMLGPSYMEGDIRAETDIQGFCTDHYKKLYIGQNRLGLALMLHTHVKKLNKDLERASKSISLAVKKSLFSKSGEPQADKMGSIIHKVEESCYVCSRIENTFKRYIDTYFYLWRQDKDMKRRTKESNGFCITHFALLIENGEKLLTAAEYKEFCDVVVPIMLENMKRIEDELDWFIKKFDYRFDAEPWKNSKDALPRGIQKVASIKVE